MWKPIVDVALRIGLAIAERRRDKANAAHERARGAPRSNTLRTATKLVMAQEKVDSLRDTILERGGSL
jgi:hypothetical protein